MHALRVAQFLYTFNCIAECSLRVHLMGPVTIHLQESIQVGNLNNIGVWIEIWVRRRTSWPLPFVLKFLVSLISVGNPVLISIPHHHVPYPW